METMETMGGKSRAGAPFVPQITEARNKWTPSRAASCSAEVLKKFIAPRQPGIAQKSAVGGAMG